MQRFFAELADDENLLYGVEEEFVRGDEDFEAALRDLEIPYSVLFHGSQDDMSLIDDFENSVTETQMDHESLEIEEPKHQLEASVDQESSDDQNDDQVSQTSGALSVLEKGHSSSQDNHLNPPDVHALSERSWPISMKRPRNKRERPSTSSDDRETDYHERITKRRVNGEEVAYHFGSEDYTDTTIKICEHCKVTWTPQWREGPGGPKTLCNACGMRYKKGRLLPQYRPAQSPSFDPGLHSNFHRKVLELSGKHGRNRGCSPLRITAHGHGFVEHSI